MAQGLDADELAAARELVDHISILPEAAIARGTAGVSAMHDVTEGGLATALTEVSTAGGHAIEIHLDRIPILPPTARICTALAIEPLGLIGSGSLLIVCRPEAADGLLQAINDQGIAAACIGEVKKIRSGGCRLPGRSTCPLAGI